MLRMQVSLDDGRLPAKMRELCAGANIDHFDNTVISIRCVFKKSNDAF